MPSLLTQFQSCVCIVGGCLDENTDPGVRFRKHVKLSGNFFLNKWLSGTLVEEFVWKNAELLSTSHRGLEPSVPDWSTLAAGWLTPILILPQLDWNSMCAAVSFCLDRVSSGWLLQNSDGLGLEWGGWGGSVCCPSRTGSNRRDSSC